MRTPINYLLLNLAAADMILAIFFVPPYILIHTFTHPHGVPGTVLCRLLTGGVLAWIGAAASVFTLVVIAIERYSAVLHPLESKGKLTYRKLKGIIPCSWIFGVIMNIPAFLFMRFDKDNYCMMIWPERWMGKAYFLAWCLLLAFLPVALMAALYSRIVYSLWVNNVDIDDNKTNRQQAKMRMRKKVTMIAITVSVIFGVCWLVDSINYTMYYFFPSHAFLSYAASSIMLLFNSAVNPIVYALVNQKFRRKFKAMLCFPQRIHHQQATADASIPAASAGGEKTE